MARKVKLILNPMADMVIAVGGDVPDCGDSDNHHESHDVLASAPCNEGHPWQI
jgi:hypothetical protein